MPREDVLPACREIATNIATKSPAMVRLAKEALTGIEDGDLAPECECGGYLKPDTISFGQAMPRRLELSCLVH